MSLQEKIAAAAESKKKSRGFTWIVEGKIAGQNFPESEEKLNEDIQKYNIGIVFTLTEAPLKYSLMSGVNVHLPIQGTLLSSERVRNRQILEFQEERKLSLLLNFAMMSSRKVFIFLRFVGSLQNSGQAVLVHCHAGYGRTGTMIGLLFSIAT
jgi:protein tyrosine phosphatase